MGLTVGALIGQRQHRFQAFGQEDGLSGSSIRVFLQDHQGFIWIGSDNGLDRFDGRNFLNFRFDPKQPNSLNANRVNSLALEGEWRLWIGTSNGLCHLDLNTGTIERVDVDDSETGAAAYDIKKVLIDSSGNIWVGTLSKGLFKLSPNTKGEGYQKKQFVPGNQRGIGLSNASVRGLFQGDPDYLWIGTQIGVDRLHIDTETFASWVDSTMETSDGGVSRLFEDKEGHIVFPILGKGAFYLDQNVTPLAPKPYFDPSGLGIFDYPSLYRDLLQDRQGRLWVGAIGGVYLVDAAKSSAEYVRYSAKQTSMVRCLMESQDGTVWVGFNTAGISRKSRTASNYLSYPHDLQDTNSPSKGQIRTMTEDHQGNLWLGYLGEGLDQFRWDEKQQSLVKLQHLQYNPAQKNSLVSNDIIQLITDSKGLLWIATNGAGLNRLDPVNGKIESHVHDPNRSSTLSGNRIWGLSEDQNGYIWVGEFTTGLNRLDPQTGTVKRFLHDPNTPNSLSNNRVKATFVDSHGDLWIGTNGGLNRLDVETEQFTHYLNNPKDTNSLSNNLVWSIYEDSLHNLWIGTSLGLNKFTNAVGQNSSSLHVERLYETDGLPSNTVLGIQGDGEGNIWVSTDNGIAQMIEDEAGYRFKTLDNDNGLAYAFYPSKAHFFSHQHQQFYFGTREDGLLVIPRQQVLPTGPFGDLLLSAVSKYTDKEKESEQWIDHFISSKRKWELTHRDRIITIKLSEINWDENSRFEYLLKGFDSNWRDLPEDMELTYTNLAVGKYTLLGRAQHQNDDAVEQVLLQLQVYPPWWKTIWAYLLYFIMGLGGIYSLYQFQLSQQLKKQETENLRALDRFKNQLYTNITHEFKTPLTIISGLVEQLTGHEKLKRIIQRNSKNLLNLVNQILDLRKLELGKLELEWVQADIVLYFRYIMESYEALADLKGVRLHFIPNKQERFMDMDKEKLLRILTNLLSNAIKFTPKGGDVYLSLEEVKLGGEEKVNNSMLRFSVMDTGVGIPTSNQAFIFDRFYQVKGDMTPGQEGKEEIFRYRGPGGGSGIGLALTKDLVQLLGGEISLRSEEGKGATFTVLLPIRQTAPIEDMQSLEIVLPVILPSDVEEVEQELNVSAQGQISSGLQLLIVEDNADVRTYLVSLLKDQYKLYLAKDGQEGVEKALEIIPDIIVSDVMMPRKDGLQLLAELKADIRTSHIPIVMLTAKSSVESRIQGLKKGADAYLAKPFNHEELFTRLAKLLELRQGLRERYANIEAVGPSLSEETAFAQEDAFIIKLKGIVEEHMEDTAFGVTELCRVMGVSRSFLHRKLKAIANTSAANFIRAVKLHRAALLLKDKSVNISEVAYQVGFHDRSYFSRVFQKEFGVSPKAYRERVG